MPARKLSDVYMQALLSKGDAHEVFSSGRHDVFITDLSCPGLRVRVRPGRRPQFEHVFRRDGKKYHPSIGTYPDTTLDAARNQVEQRRRDLAAGKLIAIGNREVQRQERQAAKAEAERRITVHRLYADWHAKDIRPVRRDEGEAIARLFRVHILPSFGQREAASIKKEDVLELLDTLRTAKKMRTANLVLQYMRRMFDWALLRDIVAVNPAAVIKRKSAGGKERPRERYLRPAEIRQLASALQGSGLTATQQHALWVLLSTLVRVGALYHAKWADIDMDYNKRNPVWRAWNEKTKGERTRYDVPLSKFALRHLRAIRNIQQDLGIYHDSQWVMRTRLGEDDKMPKPSTLTAAIRDRQFKTPARDNEKRTHNPTLVLPEGHWTIHDLRRTGASLLEALGVREEVRRSLQDHSSPDEMSIIYDQAGTPERLRWQAINKLGAELEKLMAGEHGAIENEAKAGLPRDATMLDPDDVPTGTSQQQALWRAASHSAVIMGALVATRPMTAIAREMGKSETAVRKACARLGVETPPQGHWLKGRARKAATAAAPPRARTPSA